MVINEKLVTDSLFSLPKDEQTAPINMEGEISIIRLDSY